MSLSFGAALGLLEQSSATGTLPTELADFLRNSITQLSNLHDPFNPAHTKSAAVKPPPKPTVGLQGDELKLVERVGSTFGLENQTATQIITTVKKGKDEVTEHNWDQITAHVFEERMAVIGIVATLLRTSKQPSCRSAPVAGLFRVESGARRC